jgi:hypothetical protein
MDEALMPAAPPTVQPRANETRSFDAEAGEGMRMVHAKAIESGITGFGRMSAEQRAGYNAMQRAENTKKAPAR